MTTREYYVKRMDAEGPAFIKVLRALPAQRGDYRPHPRSRSAAELGNLLVDGVKGALALVQRGRVEWADSKAGDVGTMADSYAAAHRELMTALAGVNSAAWRRKAEMLMGGQVVWTEPLGEMLFGFLFDAIHHRGQLSTYIRPMGGKVPAIYGPSADEQG